MKIPSRVERWAKAAADAGEALQTLIELQEEYQNWLDNLPENFQGGALAEKLQTVCDLDLQSALDTANEAENTDLPRGFGKD
jgi:hypothetical protein